MKQNQRGNHRRSYRFQGHDYSAAAAYFITIVAKNRTCSFGHVAGDEMILNPLGRIADEYLRSISEHFPNAEIDVHQVMPNHVHGIIVLYENHHRTAQAPSDVGATHWVAPTGPRGPARGSIGAMIGAYKMAVTRWAMHELNTSDIWQRNYYDHIIRGERDWQAIREYIMSNPAYWGEDEENPGKIRPPK